MASPIRISVLADATKAVKGLKDTEQAAESAGKKASSFGKVFAGLASLGAGAAAGKFFVGAIHDAQDGIKAMKVLNNQIVNLEPSGRKAFAGASDFADKFGVSIGQDDDAVRAVMSKLASFPDAFKAGSLGAEGMQRSVKAAFDLQAIGIGDASSNIVGIGKAMNDPIKGMGALAKSGVSFTAEQQKQIKNFVTQGKLGQAQKVLLAGIESNAKGAALAAAAPMEKVKVAFDQIVGSVAEKFVPFIDKFAGVLTAQALPAAQALADWLGPKIEPTMKAVSAVLAGAGKFARELFANFKSQGGIEDAGAQFKEMGANVQKLAPLIVEFRDSLPSLNQIIDVTGTVIGFLAGHVDTLRKLMPFLLAAFVAYKLAQAAANVAALAAVPIRVMEFLATRAHTKALRELAAVQATTTVETVLATGATEANAVANGAGAAAANAAAGATAGATAATEGAAAASGAAAGAKEAEVVATNTGIIASARAKAAMIGQAIATKTVAAATKVWTAIQAAFNFVMALNPIALVVIAIVALVAAIIIAYKKSETFRKIVDAAFRGIKAVAISVFEFLKKYIGIAIDYVVSTVKNGIAGFVAVWNGITAIYNKVNEFRNKVIGYVLGLVKRFTDIGKNIMGGLRDGIAAGIQWVKDKVKGLGGLIPGWLKSVLGIASPSRVMTDIGTQIVAGLTKGIGEQVPALKRELAGVSTVIESGVTAAPAIALGTTGGAGGALGAVIINVYASPLTDPAETGREVAKALNAFARSRGIAPVVAGATL